MEHMEQRIFVNSKGASHVKISRPERPEMNFNTADIIFAFVMLACGFLYWNLLDLFMLGAGVTIFAIVLFTASFVYLSKSGVKQNTKSLICLVLAALSTVQFVLFDNGFISFLNLQFLMGLFIYWICLSTGRQLDQKLSIYIIGDAFKQVINIPFKNFSCCFVGAKKGFSKQKKGKGFLAGLIGILIFLPALAIVVNLLVSADLAFEIFVGRIIDWLNAVNVIHYIWQFIIGIPVAFYLYGLIYGNVKGRYDGNITSQSVDRAAQAVKIAPRITIYSALTAFNMIYLVFFAVQAGYLFSAFTANLPETFTYAEYARRGFFELCAVAGINLGILAVAHLTVKKEMGEEPKLLKIQTLLISLFTILLIATALSKMIMYINVYGLTQLRVFTSWFMILLFFVFAIICVRQFKKFNSTRGMIVAFVVMFMILSYGNVDGLIARYNIARYEAGTLQMLDVHALERLSDAAIPQLYDLYLKTDDEEMRERLALAFTHRRASTDFRGFNVQRHRANEIREKFIIKIMESMEAGNQR